MANFNLSIDLACLQNGIVVDQTILANLDIISLAENDG